MKRKNIEVFNKDFFLLLAIILGPFLFITTNDFDLSIKLTLLSELLIIIMISYYYLYFDKINIANSIVIVFFLLFFIIAPSIQLGKQNLFLVNTLPIETTNLCYVNVLVIFFLLSYSLTYVCQNSNDFKCIFYSNSNFFTLNILLLLSVLASSLAINEMVEKINTLTFISSEEESTFSLLLRKKILYNIPLATLLYLTTIEFKFHKIKIIIILLLLGLIILTKNPLLEKRSGLGPTYFMLLYIFKPNLFNSNTKILATFVSIFVFLFPLTSIFTHSSIYSWGRVQEISVSSMIYEHFNSLHYDAWSNVDSAVRYTQDNGFKFGMQLMGVILFFIPRSLWVEKPIATGHLVGEYLINNFSMWFDNLSSPIISEGYVDFGVFGVIFYGIILAIIVNFINNNFKSSNKLLRYTSIYIAFSLMFVLRGSLMASYSYICASIFTFIIFPLCIDFIYSKLFRFKITLK